MGLETVTGLMIVNTSINMFLYRNISYQTFYFKQKLFSSSTDSYSMFLLNYGVEISLLQFMNTTCAYWTLRDDN